MSKSAQKAANQFRVIGGEWRSRRLNFAPNAQLRPTADRVRETLFNWLGQDVLSAHCLDLFAGSGSLGLEALSRGALGCDFIDSHRDSLRQIKENLVMLNAEPSRFNLHSIKAKEFLAATTKNYNLVFLDPPFGLNMIAPIIPQLDPILKAGSKIYVEIEKKGELPELPEHWQVIREKTAGQVRYHLILVE